MAFVQTNTSNVTPLVKTATEERIKHTIGTSNCTFDADGDYKHLNSTQVAVYLRNSFTVANVAKCNSNRHAEAVRLGADTTPQEVTRIETTIKVCAGNGFVVHLTLYGLDDTGTEMVIEVRKMGFISHVDFGRQLLPDFIETVTKHIMEEEIYIKFGSSTVTDIF